MATGTAEINFGLDESSASVDVTGQSGLTGATHIEAWPMAEASSDGSRTADEAIIDPVILVAERLDAVSFRIHATALEGVISGKVPVRWATL